MFRTFVVALFILFSVFANSAELYSFKEWKNQKVVAAEAAVSVIAASNLQKDQQKASRLYFNLELAKELSIQDYFTIYLISQDNPRSAMAAVAAKLSPEEVVELMEAYSKVVNKNDQHLFRPIQSKLDVDLGNR